MRKQFESQQVMLPVRSLLDPEIDGLRSLWDIVDCYQRNIILRPPHQRDQVWSKEKKMGWIERIRSGRKTIGVIVTYQLTDGTRSPTYLNDGYQRVSATLEYLQNSESYGDSMEDANRIVRSIMMPWQHRHYQTHDEALYDFQALNLGTALSPYEFYKGIITYMPKYDLWQPILEDLHRVIPAAIQRIGERRYSMNRDTQHKEFRADYAIFHRFITRTTDMRDYEVADKRPTQSGADSKRIVEKMLRSALEDISPLEGARLLENFRRLIERETALIETIWFQELNQQTRSRGLSSTLLRWLFDVSVWRQNVGVEYVQWDDFVRKVLIETDGGAQLLKRNEKGEIRKYTFALARLSSMKGVCEMIDSDMHTWGRELRRSSITRLRPGYDESHILPFSAHGNGETIGEPAGRNRSRGAHPIADSNRH